MNAGNDDWEKRLPWIGIAAVIVLAVIQLHHQGRIWWCACGGYNLWAGDIWTSHNSQHLFDPYSFTHVLHGVVFCGLVTWLLPRLPLAWRLFVVICIEAGWELLENSRFIIMRYREATMALGYEGDTITNSMGDILCCTAGFFLAKYIGCRRSIVLFIVTELVLLFWIRDNLTLNVLMLVRPIDAIKAWQVVH